MLNGKVRYAAIWTNQHSVDWFAYHAIPLSEHEKNFEKYANEGWVPVNVSCTLSGGKILVSAIWEKKDVGGFYLKPVMTLKQYKEAFKAFTDKEKFKLIYLDAYTIAGIPMLSGIWYKNAPGYSSGQQSIISSQQSLMQSMAHFWTRDILQNVWQVTEADLLTGLKESGTNEIYAQCLNFSARLRGLLFNAYYLMTLLIALYQAH
ncbi:MAG: hypothetical protein IPG02_02005 [Ignavibacteria bacterium]|nr:hypothetical protein [Ignavibacteria bacterium]